MDTYQNKECKLIPFKGNVLNSFVLTEKWQRVTTPRLKSEQGNEDVLLTRMEKGQIKNVKE